METIKNVLFVVIAILLPISVGAWYHERFKPRENCIQVSMPVTDWVWRCPKEIRGQKLASGIYHESDNHGAILTCRYAPVDLPSLPYKKRSTGF